MNEIQAEIFDLVAFKRAKKAREDNGVCEKCNKPRVVCQAYGRPCIYSEE